MNYTDGKGSIVTKVSVRCLEFHLIIILCHQFLEIVII